MHPIVLKPLDFLPQCNPALQPYNQVIVQMGKYECLVSSETLLPEQGSGVRLREPPFSFGWRRWPDN